MIRDNHPLLFALNNEGMSIVPSYCGGTETTYKTDQTYTSSVDSIEDGTNPELHIPSITVGLMTSRK